MALKETHFSFENQSDFYRGKVRDVYYFEDKVAMVASDRISAFDVILPEAIPFKGQVLNQMAYKFLTLTQGLIPNWVISSPDPNVTIGHHCQALPVEMVIRGYLAGHAWREYQAGKRSICGVPLPDGLKENGLLPAPIITPTTKASKGHDEDISRSKIIEQGLVNEELYEKMEDYTLQLFAFGSEYAASRGLILVDTKYEFGLKNGKLLLIDEIHTPDSSRYFYSESYETLQREGKPQKQLSKEFVRQWLISEGFQGQEGQRIPEMTAEIVHQISLRYIELYEKMTGEKFEPATYDNIEERIKTNISKNL